jgi:Flp pilus assembly protein TadD
VIRQCEIYEQRNPKSYLGYLLHASALIQQMQGSPEADALAAQAQELLTQSLQLEQRDSKSHALMGQLLERKKDYAAAARELEKSVALDPKDSAARFRLARVYERLGRKEDAAAQRALHEKLVEAEQASPAALPTVVSPSK